MEPERRVVKSGPRESPIRVIRVIRGGSTIRSSEFEVPEAKAVAPLVGLAVPPHSIYSRFPKPKRCRRSRTRSATALHIFQIPEAKAVSALADSLCHRTPYKSERGKARSV